MHAMPTSACSDPATFGEGTIDHEVPSHDSVSVCVLLAASLYAPTAKHRDGSGHDTSLNDPALAPMGFGEGTTAHPFAASAGAAPSSATTMQIRAATNQRDIAHLIHEKR